MGVVYTYEKDKIDDANSAVNTLNAQGIRAWLDWSDYDHNLTVKVMVEEGEEESARNFVAKAKGY